MCFISASLSCSLPCLHTRNTKMSWSSNLLQRSLNLQLSGREMRAPSGPSLINLFLLTYQTNSYPNDPRFHLFKKTAEKEEESTHTLDAHLLQALLRVTMHQLARPAHQTCYAVLLWSTLTPTRSLPSIHLLWRHSQTLWRLLSD